MTCLGRHRGQAELYLQPIRNPVPEGCGRSATRSASFTPGKDPSTHGSGSCVGLGTALEGTENLSVTGIQSPEIPASSELLYRLRYLAPRRRIFNFVFPQCISDHTVHRGQ